MAGMYCSKCGTKLREGAVFCSKCGREVPKQRLAEAAAQTAEAAGSSSGQLCPKCGARLKEGASFCSKCGSDVPKPVIAAAAAFKAAPAVQQVKSTVNILGSMTEAPSMGGEFVIPDRSAIILPASSIPTPVNAAFGGLRRILTGLKRLPKNPKAAITAILMAAFWIAIMIWNQSDSSNPVSGILSFLTFAEGGSLGNPLNKIGGIFGKGLILTLVMRLFSGGLSGIPAGCRRLFTRGINIGMLLAGLGISVMAYQLFAGYAGEYGAMVALSGSLLSLNALGGGAGYLATLAASLTARRVKGIRKMNGRRFKSALIGMSVGFFAAAALSRFHYPVWIPLIAAVLGIVLAVVIPERGGAEV